MTYTRKDLKDKAKVTLKASYWKCVLTSIILGCCVGAGSSSTGNSASKDLKSEDFSNLSPSQIGAILAVVIAAVGVTAIIAIAVDIFLLKPLEVGCRRFYIDARTGDAKLGNLGYGFKNSYGNVAKIQFLRGLFTALWTMLFVIPGIVKSYEYRMIPFIIAENPGMSSSDVFALSKKMMKGEKWNAFVFDLSFILWWILSAITLGIVGLFYVNPYYDNSCTELYATLKAKAEGTAA